MSQKKKSPASGEARLFDRIKPNTNKLNVSIAEVKSGVKSPGEQQSLWDVIFGNLYKLRMKG